MTPPGGDHGPFPVPSVRRKPSRARPSGTASRGWTPGPANGSRVPPVLVRSAAQQHAGTRALLQAARDTRPGDAITAPGTALFRPAAASATVNVWAGGPATGKRRNLTAEEDRAFWAWATIEILRSTGIRVEELVQLSHHSFVQYRLPGTGGLVPLLQIIPSKTDASGCWSSASSSPTCSAPSSAGSAHQPRRAPRRRLRRSRTPVAAARPGAVPAAHRRREPAIPAATIRKILTSALARTALTGPADAPLHYTPHDFRRMFLTDAIMNGLPPHIAQVIAGHRDINVTLGYKAVYPDEAIQAHLAFLARRRALRPTEEYRTPTDAEWEEFLGHFELRKVATGTCGRAFSTPCIHEHSCLRCSMHWPDPAQRNRIAEIRDNLTARIAEANREGWLGEAEGLKISLAGAQDKLAQIDRRTRTPTPVGLGMPALSRTPTLS
jgi:integrase-like protein